MRFDLKTRRRPVCTSGLLGDKDIALAGMERCGNGAQNCDTDHLPRIVSFYDSRRLVDGLASPLMPANRIGARVSAIKLVNFFHQLSNT
jgi:hypothetical protein